ncbi:hypothetical protein H7J86_32090 [Mycobacterium hackensackense]|nr:hypothetical protein [Mycobacterium hackensackense]
MRVMKAYIYASPAGAAAHVLSQCFSDFAELYRRGFLRDDSIVWANAEAPDASFWALTDRSQYVYVHRATEPGYVRLTSGRLRWGRSFDGTLEKFEVDVDTRNIAGEPDKHLTLIVKHRAPGRLVKVIDGSRLVELVDGSYTRPEATVIDLAAYRPPTDVAAAGEFEVNHARYHGVNHMMSSLNADNAELIRSHLGLFAFDISAEQIAAINEHLHVVETFADGFAEALYDRLARAHSGTTPPD